MAIAIRARAVTTTDQRRIYLALWSRIARRPMQILLPVGLD
jgi:site-specific recombinase